MQSHTHTRTQTDRETDCNLQQLPHKISRKKNEAQMLPLGTEFKKHLLKIVFKLRFKGNS